MDATQLKNILTAHRLRLQDPNKGTRANLRGANLRSADLYGADLRGADLRSADLYGADLRGADLEGANLRSADLRSANLRSADLYGADLEGANLRSADLRSANLRGADLEGANLRSANLRSADLYGADLRSADLRGADLPHFQIPDGDLVGWKKLRNGYIARLRIPYRAKRTTSLVGRKCRCEFAVVVEISGSAGPEEDDFLGRSGLDNTVYRVGETVHPDKYDDDFRVECTNGIHFFLTRKEAEEW